MKAYLTAFGICALMIMGAQYANAANTYWTGLSSTDGAWNDPTNWTNGVPDNVGDFALITSKTGSHWPYLDQDYTSANNDTNIGVLWMENDVTLDVNGHTLEVSNSFNNGQFVVIDQTSDSTPTSVTITNSGSAGGIKPQWVVISGGADGVTISISDDDTSVETE